MRILVTGGTGFVGSNLVRELAKEDHDIIVTGTNTEAKIPEVKKFLNLHLDGIDFNQISKVDIVFHIAANNDTLDSDEDEMMRANFVSPITLFYRALYGGCKKFVYASSTAVYGDSPSPYVEDKTPLNPLNAYARSKAKFEVFATNFAKSSKAQVVGLRYCNVYGPGESHKGHRASMIYQVVKQMMSAKRPKLFKHGGQKRDYIYVKDVVRANILASKYDGSGIFNCGFGNATSFNDLVHMANNELKTNYQPEYIENPYEANYQSHTKCDMKKASQELGFTPEYSVAKGMSEYIPYLKK